MMPVNMLLHLRRSNWNEPTAIDEEGLNFGWDACRQPLRFERSPRPFPVAKLDNADFSASSQRKVHGFLTGP